MKPIHYIIAMFILGLLIVVLGYMVQYTTAKLISQQSAIDELNAEITYRKNKEGELIASKQAAEIRAADLEKMYPKITEEIKKEFDIKLKDVKAYVKNQIQAQGKGETVTSNYYRTDSTGRKQFTQEIRIDDGYLSMDAVILDTNRVSYSYLYSDTITTVLSTHRKWLLGDEKIVASTRMKNRNAKVTDATNILISNHRDKRFVLSAGVYYDPFRQNYGVGINFGYALIKF